MSEETPLPSSDADHGGLRGKRAATGFASETDAAAAVPPPSSSSFEGETLLGQTTPAARAEVIGDFEIHGKLGQGGMGAVYRARQISLDRQVALKILPAAMESDDTFVTRFQREARIAASLNHRNLVRVYASGQADGCHFIAMELIEGETLGQWLKRGALPPMEALRICRDVARALDHGWRHAHLIHRDIKPGNIFLSEEGEVKVGDLGLAKSMGADTTGLTHTGTAMGTPHYISPEQARGDKDLDFRADIYSLGCTLYQMLTARTPYEGRDPLSVMNQHINAPPPALLKVLPQCPIPLARLVGKMLKKVKRERQATYEELIAQIESVLTLFAPAESPLESTLPPDPDATMLATPGASATPQSATPVTAPVAPPARPPAKKSPSLLYGGIGAGALALVLGLAAFFLLRPREEKLTKAQIAMREREAVLAAATPVPAPKWENLIALVDPQRDALAAEWKIENGALVCSRPGPWGLCVIPLANPPANYDLRYRVTRGEGMGVGFFFPFRKGSSGGGDVIFDYGSPNVPKWGGLESIGGNKLTQTGTKRDMWLPKGQECTILVQVRDEGLAVRLNDEEVFRWTGDWSRIRQRGGVENELFRKVGDQKIFGVGLFNSQAVYHSIEMREVPGEEGRTLPPKPPAAEAGWQDVLRDPGQLVLAGNTQRTPEGLILSRDAAIAVRSAQDRQRDGAIRMRIAVGKKHPRLSARATPAGNYYLDLNGSTAVVLCRWDGAASKWILLNSFDVSPPLTPGQSVELELRAVGQTLSAKLDGAVLGAVEDSVFDHGSFKVNNSDPAAQPTTIQALGFLDLDAK